tara:strand:+ start:1186 stop:1551 length:366 start_codon:yes stop_codon:yes gene_type:complete
MKDNNFTDLKLRHECILRAIHTDDAMKEAEKAYGFLDMSNPFKEDEEGANYLEKFVDHLDLVCEVLYDEIIELWEDRNIKNREDLMFFSQRAYAEIIRYLCVYEKMLKGVEKERETRGLAR